jgi:hypothetical protein
VIASKIPMVEKEEGAASVNRLLLYTSKCPRAAHTPSQLIEVSVENLETADSERRGC